MKYMRVSENGLHTYYIVGKENHGVGRIQKLCDGWHYLVEKKNYTNGPFETKRDAVKNLFAYFTQKEN